MPKSNATDKYKTPLPAAPTVEDAIVMRLDRLILLMCEVFEEIGSSPSRLAYGGGPNQRRLENYPIAGVDRVSVVSNPVGGVIQVGTVPQKIVDHFIGRGGMSLQNTGSNGCFVYLTGPGEAANGGVATGYLPPGGSFNGKISDEVWCGPVSAQGDGGATTLVLAVI